MTKAEFINVVQGYEEEAHIQAFKTIIERLQKKYAEIDLNLCLAEYKYQIEWLNSDADTKLHPCMLFLESLGKVE